MTSFKRANTKPKPAVAASPEPKKKPEAVSQELDNEWLAKVQQSLGNKALQDMLQQDKDQPGQALGGLAGAALGAVAGQALGSGPKPELKEKPEDQAGQALGGLAGAALGAVAAQIASTSSQAPAKKTK